MLAEMRKEVFVMIRSRWLRCLLLKLSLPMGFKFKKWNHARIFLQMHCLYNFSFCARRTSRSLLCSGRAPLRVFTGPNRWRLVWRLPSKRWDNLHLYQWCCKIVNLELLGYDICCLPWGSCGPAPQMSSQCFVAIVGGKLIIRIKPNCTTCHAEPMSGRCIIISVVPICRLTKKQCTKPAWSNVWGTRWRFTADWSILPYWR